MVVFRLCEPGAAREQFERRGIPWSDSCFAYETEWERDRAWILCSCSGTQAEILALDHICGDLAAEGLMRAGLNFAAGKSAYTAVCRVPELFRFLIPFGFRQGEGEVWGEIPEILTGSCCG